MIAALDIAILLPEEAAAIAVSLNRRLDDGTPSGLRLDATHLPHITLVQLFAREESFPALFREVDRAAAPFGPLTLAVRGLAQSPSSTAMLMLEPDDDLQALHRALMKAVCEFEVPGDAGAFFTEGDLPARERDVAWVAGYRGAHALENYLPHVTIGHGYLAGDLEHLSFRTDRLAACRLGRYCTCRLVLHERRL